MNRRFTIDGCEWDVYDFVQEIAGRRGVPLGSSKATARAFVPVGGGMVMVYQFGAVAYRDTAPRTLEQQLRYARALEANAAQRLDGGSNATR